ncbi:hypothetical protein SAMN06295967_10713 [Belliella buryatensis]|uniref:Membrane or secreted protein n=1 Tax=Belliella buryatensis TaxID=1500549 RepID=A0A239DE35_9BACT|nr:hypothetical protein [Belliella buryatensis]SNS30706.1 hypothetical protein SAMN06295967_10713 [Belliella buryatensis]
MKKILILPLLFLMGTVIGQTLEGAWKLTHQNGKEVTDKTVVKIFQDGYFSYGSKETNTNKFLGAGGGEFSLRDNYYTESFDFNTEEDLIGVTVEYSLDMVDGKIVTSIEKGGTANVQIWTKVSDAKDDLTRNWVFTGRKNDGEISRSTPGARRTVKILSGGHFQWIAFNSETKQFSGTGGGTYTAKEGKYIENIEFFSRDDNRVGASLEFNYEVIDGEWHHSGMSSTGNPIYEIWSKYSDAYKKPSK